MMIRWRQKQILSFLLALLIAMSIVACGKEPVDTTTSSDTTDTTEPIASGYPDPGPVKDTRITVINGTANGSASLLCSLGEVIRLKAAVPAKGYSFTHWEDADGNVVSTEKIFDVTVNAEASYKAYYEVSFGSVSQQIMTNVAESWRQGAFNGDMNAWTSGSDDLTRISFAEPFLLSKGATLSVVLPTATCPQAAGACPKLDGNGDCGLRAAFVTLKPTGTQTGDITLDYRIVKGSWGESMTATEDVYISVMIKWDKHGSQPLSVSGEWLHDVKVYYAEPTDASGYPIGSHWNVELEEAIEQIEANREAAEGGLSEFFYLTDVHWLHNAQFSPALINYLAEKLGEYDVIFGGDVIEYHNTSKQKAIDQEIKAFYHALEGYTKVGEELNVFSTIGNHDRNRADAEALTILHIDEATMYELYLKRVEEFGVTAFGNTNQSYFDDTENKVRYVQFYLVDNKYNVATNAYTEAALDWVEERIMELEEDWTVVVFTHGYWRYNSDTTELDVFSKNVAYKDRLLAIKEAASAEIAAWFVGHAHVNHTEILTSENTDETLLIVAFNSDSYQNSRDETFNADADGVDMRLGTVTEQSFSYVQIDTAQKKIYVTGIGAAIDAVYSYGE